MNIEPVKPFLKWAGGKTQMLDSLARYVPARYNGYIEPFLGAGALFFFLRPQNAILSDSNGELINTYLVVRDAIDDLIELLVTYPHDEKFYYQIRAVNPDTLNKVERAARFIYLNRTCYNGLYRVNKKGQFNVPFGKYVNPTICDSETLRSASAALKGTTILESDYKDVLQRYANPNNFIYLDPPYFPISVYSDFKRYTKDFFYESDQIQLAAKFSELVDMGAHVVLTNSAAPLIRTLYQDFPQALIKTNRNINSKGGRRKNGEDLIVYSTSPLQMNYHLPVREHAAT